MHWPAAIPAGQASHSAWWHKVAWHPVKWHALRHTVPLQAVVSTSFQAPAVVHTIAVIKANALIISVHWPQLMTETNRLEEQCNNWRWNTYRHLCSLIYLWFILQYCQRLSLSVNELENLWKVGSWPYIKCCHDTSLETMTKTTRKLSHNTPYLSWHFNGRPPKHEIRLSTQLPCLVFGISGRTELQKSKAKESVTVFVLALYWSEWRDNKIRHRFFR